MPLNKFCRAMTLAASIAASPYVSAQATSPAPDPTTQEGRQAEGKARYERGAEAYANGRYKDAIELFLQADALAPSAALSFNIARAYEKISDDAASLQWYRDFRRRAPDAANGVQADERIHALEGLLATKGVQQLTVLSSPLGATVIVDEQPVGVTPFTGQFPPGAHKVVLSLKGYADAEHRVDLAAGHAQDLMAPLVPDTRSRSNLAVASENSAVSTTNQPSGPGAKSDGPPGRRFGIWPWVGLGAGALALGAAAGFEVARRGAENDAEQDSTQVGYKEKLDRMQSHQATARVLGAVGGALALTGGVLLVIDLTSRRSEAEKPAIAWSCLGGGCGVQLQGRF